MKVRLDNGFYLLLAAFACSTQRQEQEWLMNGKKEGWYDTYEQMQIVNRVRMRALELSSNPDSYRIDTDALGWLY